jgi:hypothetical protein
MTLESDTTAADALGASQSRLVVGCQRQTESDSAGPREKVSMPHSQPDFENGAVPRPAATNGRQHAERRVRRPIARQARGTFELKFRVDSTRAAEIMAWSRRHLAADPHCDPQLGDGYLVNSVYLDTPTFHIYGRTGVFKGVKFRLRRYGSEQVVWLERKRKWGRLVRKRRLAIADAELDHRLTMPPDKTWPGHWFRWRLDQDVLRPVCQVTYQRFVRVGSTAQGPVRLTIDSALRAEPAIGWDVPSRPLNSDSLLADEQIVEFKFSDSLPAMFRGLIQDMSLRVTSFSKYRLSIGSCLGHLLTDGPAPGAENA